MMTTLREKAVVIGIAGAITLTALTPAWAVPVMSSTATVKAAMPDQITDVRYRRYHRGYGGGAAFAGLAFGLIGSAIAASQYRQSYGYYGQPYYYGSPYAYAPAYGYGYAPAPVYGYGGGYYGGGGFRGYGGGFHHHH